MRKIQRSNSVGNLEIDVSPELVNHVARTAGIDAADVTDDAILRFFNLVASSAFDRASAEYVADNDKDTRELRDA